MSNFYAKAINPRTHQEEDCTFIDTGKDTFIEFKDGWKYNTKFFNSPISESPKSLSEFFNAPTELKESILKDVVKKSNQDQRNIMTEQEAINQDGEETIEEFELYFGKPSTGKEIIATLGVSLFMTGLLAVLIVGVVNCVQIAWRVIERVI
jgi:hypothetical protein